MVCCSRRTVFAVASTQYQGDTRLGKSVSMNEWLRTSLLPGFVCLSAELVAPRNPLVQRYISFHPVFTRLGGHIRHSATSLSKRHTLAESKKSTDEAPITAPGYALELHVWQVNHYAGRLRPDIGTSCRTAIQSTMTDRSPNTEIQSRTDAYLSVLRKSVGSCWSLPKLVKSMDAWTKGPVKNSISH